MNIGIIGGGVAGMSCALWLKHLGFTPIIIEQNQRLGGQLLELNRINRWVLGSIGKTSIELADGFAAHINEESIARYFQTQLCSITSNREGYELQLQENANVFSVQVKAIVIATGVKPLRHEVFENTPGFQSIANAGRISFLPIDHIEKLPELTTKTVAVFGGGDNAHFTAKDLALNGTQVFLLTRSTAKARKVIRLQVEDLIKQGMITKYNNTTASAFQNQMNGVEITLQKSNAVTEILLVDRIFVRIGFTANTEFLDAFDVFSNIEKTSGYLKTDGTKRTSIPWVYAIGDVANRKHQSVVNAIADGAIAARDLSERL